MDFIAGCGGAGGGVGGVSTGSYGACEFYFVFWFDSYFVVCYTGGVCGGC